MDGWMDGWMDIETCNGMMRRFHSPWKTALGNFLEESLWETPLLHNQGCVFHRFSFSFPCQYAMWHRRAKPFCAF